MPGQHFYTLHVWEYPHRATATIRLAGSTVASGVGTDVVQAILNAAQQLAGVPGASFECERCGWSKWIDASQFRDANPDDHTRVCSDCGWREGQPVSSDERARLSA